MIDNSTYTAQWIESVSKQNRNTDRILIEKVIRALTLLSELNSSGLKFIFKGGTALMLMLEKPTRLSIDIDIIIENSEIDLDSKFSEICKRSSFLRFTRQDRFSESKIEKAHYKFYYNPVYDTHSQEEYVILDILFETNPYNKLVHTQVKNSFVRLSGDPDMVITPSFEDILGDKLTAFAPNTTGVPYFKGKTSMSMEIVKQLYDVGNLFDVVSNISEVKSTFEKIAINELRYRKLDNLNLTDILQDIINTSFCISTRGLSGNCLFANIQNGIKQIGSYIYSSRYIIEDATVSASKAAYLACLIKSGNYQVNRFISLESVKDSLITNPAWNKLNKLKSSLPEAFWYWHKAIELI